jgi:hypothetical protein
MKSKSHETKKSHTIVFGGFFLIFIALICMKLTEAVVLNPEDMIIHTNVVYYDGKFSDTGKVEDTRTALYVLNQSDETIYATIYEYDKNKKEVKTAVQITGRQNQFIKTDGPGVVYLNNMDNTSTSIIKFSRWPSLKRYYTI